MKRLAILAAFFMAGPAVAQEVRCGGYADAVAGLASEYGETLAVSMLTAEGTALQVFANDDLGTWTMLQVFANGMACYVAHGTALEVAPVRGDL